MTLRPHFGGQGFSGRSPGGRNRWSGRERKVVPLQPELVVEVSTDHITDRHFRHGAQSCAGAPTRSRATARWIRSREDEPVSNTTAPGPDRGFGTMLRSSREDVDRAGPRSGQLACRRLLTSRRRRAALQARPKIGLQAGHDRAGVASNNTVGGDHGEVAEDARPPEPASGAPLPFSEVTVPGGGGPMRALVTAPPGGVRT